MPIREIISAYGQPIIAGLTPYTRRTIELPETTPDWPPFVDAERLEVLKTYTALIENRPQDIFEDLQLREGQKEKIALAIALPELLCNVWADAIWSDPPTVEMPSDALDERWQAIDEANDFTEIGGWESVFGAAAWGTSILKLRVDEARLDQWDSDVVIEEIDPAIYFPRMKRGSSRDVDSVVLAWEEDRADPDAERRDLWQVRVLHFIENGNYRIVTQERRPQGISGRVPFAVVKQETIEGVDFLPFVDLHAKRWRGRYWGVSELSRQMTIFDEVDNTISNIAEILEYHGKPMLQVPASVIYGGDLVKGVDKAIGIRRPEEAEIARYITFDGKVDDQLAHLDKLAELAFLTNESPRTYFGLGTESAPPSGVALKLQLQNFLKKAGRWQRNETLRLRQLIPMAIALDAKVPIAKLSDALPKIVHGSPLPADDMQDAQIEQGLYGAGLSSRELSIRKLRRVPSDEVDEEVARIEDEKAASVAALPAPLRDNASGGSQDGSGRPVNSSTDPNAADGPAA